MTGDGIPLDLVRVSARAQLGLLGSKIVKTAFPKHGAIHKLIRRVWASRGVPLGAGIVPLEDGSPWLHVRFFGKLF